MKAIASIAFGIAASVGACAATATMVSAVMAEPEAHTFANVSTPDLWTSKPVPVERAAEHYERLPAVLSTYAANSAVRRIDKPAAVTDVALKDDKPALSTQHLTWCAGRYRSFDPATNRYRSFSGDMRTCISPFDMDNQSTTPDAQVQKRPSAAAPAVAAWCSARYQSYRIEDNTYQPYDAPRRACEGPRPTDQVASNF